MKKTVYIFSSGKLERRDNTLYFESDQNTRKFLPVEDTSDLMVFGEVTLNKRFLEFVSQKEILLHYFNQFGYYMGTFYPREHYVSGYMILRQAAHYLDDSLRLFIARQFVLGAARNIRQVLRYYQNRNKEVGDRLAAIEELVPRIGMVTALDVLMALEGNIRDQYYRAFDAIHGQSAFAFDGRSRRPPKNQMNTLISFGNSLLYATALSELYRTHLDPRIGFLHATNFRRFSLNLDIAEIFKPIIVDRAIFTLVGKKMVQKSDFEKHSGGIFLQESGRKVFVEEFEKRLKTVINHRELGRPVSYRRIIRMEAYKLQKHLMNDSPYDPFLSRW